MSPRGVVACHRSDNRGTADLTRRTQEWYARDFGLVQFSVRTTGEGVLIERDVTVTSSSRPVVLKRVVARR
jgi:hypothetical protein